MPRTADAPTGRAMHGHRRVSALATACAAGVLLFGAEPALALTVTPASINGVEGAGFSGMVATFTTDPALGAVVCPAVYSATVTWSGDSQASPATIGPGALSPDKLTCSYTVSDAHALDEEGETATLGVAGPTGAPTVTQVPAVVADAPLSMSPVPASAVVGTPLQATAGTLTDANPNATPADFSATIDWGDGTPPISATVAPGSSGTPFAVTGVHTYAQAGSFATTITVHDDGGSTGSVIGTATVTAPPAPAPPPPPPPVAPKATGPPTMGIAAPRLNGARAVSLRLTCPPMAVACRGVARVYTLPATAGKGRLEGGTPLGSALFILAPGEAKTVVIGVPPRLRRVLRHGHSARLAGVTITFGSGGHSAASAGPVAIVSTVRLQ